MKILVVDSDLDNIDDIRLFFEEFGVRYVVAANAREAIYKLRNEEFNVIITEVEFGREDGVKSIRDIYNVANMNKLDRFVIMNREIEQHRIFFQKLKNVLFLEKPIDLERLKDVLFSKRKENQIQDENTLSFLSGERVISEGDDSDCLFFVKEGELKVIKRNEHNIEVEVARIQKGEVIGEIALIEEGKRTASVYAVRNSVLIKIPKEKLEKYFQAEPRWIKALFTTISNRLKNTTSELANFKKERK